MFLLHLLYFCSLLISCRGWLVQVDSHTEECFYEKVDKGAKLSLSFQVTEGGFLDIDVNIFGPDRHEIYEGTRESSGKYTFSAYEDGKYKFCFSNRMSTITPKSVKFDVSVGNKADLQQNEQHNSNRSVTDALQESVVELKHGLWGINREQEYINARMNMHHRINEHTNHVVVRWCFYELILIIAGMCFEIWYIKRFFEVRRII